MSHPKRGICNPITTNTLSSIRNRETTPLGSWTDLSNPLLSPDSVSCSHVSPSEVLQTSFKLMGVAISSKQNPPNNTKWLPCLTMAGFRLLRHGGVESRLNSSSIITLSLAIQVTEVTWEMTRSGLRTGIGIGLLGRVKGHLSLYFALEIRLLTHICC